MNGKEIKAAIERFRKAVASDECEDFLDQDVRDAITIARWYVQSLKNTAALHTPQQGA